MTKRCREWITVIDMRQKLSTTAQQFEKKVILAYISPIAVSYIIKIKEGSRQAGRQQAFKEGSRHARKVIFQLFEFGKNLKNSDPPPLSQSESTFEM